VGRIALSVLFLAPFGRCVFLFRSGLRSAGGHTPDRMPESPFFAGWTSCPRCRHELEREEKAVRCPSCGLCVYANPAPTASALVLDDEGRVLLARRSGDPGAGLWDLVGGFVEEGEDPLGALHREVREETGLEIEPVEFLGGYSDRYGEGGIYTLNLYWTARIAAGRVEIDDDELAEVAWFAPDELPEDGEFAFANTLRALAAWRSGLRSAGPKK
jgi:8-oxo-dGTP diphosphatase